MSSSPVMQQQTRCCSAAGGFIQAGPGAASPPLSEHMFKHCSKQSGHCGMAWVGWAGPGIQGCPLPARFSLISWHWCMIYLPDRRKRRLRGHVCPREKRYLGGQLELQPARCCGNRSWLFLSETRAQIREVPSETGNCGLTQFGPLFCSALLFNCLGHSRLQKKVF